MIALRLNPFRVQKVDDLVTVPPGDVPELHAEVLEKCDSLLGEVRGSGHSVGMLVVGEAGSGKSHMVAQLRQRASSDAKTVMVAVPLRGAYAGKLWRHLRVQMVSDLLQDNRSRGGDNSGLTRMLSNQFPQWAKGGEGLLNMLLGGSRNLEPFLDRFAQSCTFDYALQKVLPRLADAKLTNLARNWLRGQQLGDEDLTRLGLPVGSPTEQEQEINARNVVLSLLRLAGDKTTPLICFDEVEALQAGTGDAAVLRQFTTLVTDLLAATGPRVVVTCIRPRTWLEVRKAVEHSNTDKIGQHKATIPPLTWEQTVRIVLSRLEAESGCREARREHAENRFWPLGETFVADVFENNRRDLTPRHLIGACACEFDRIVKGKPATALPPTETDGLNESARIREPATQAALPTEDFGRMWERHVKRHLERLQGIKFDTIMALGLPWLLELFGEPFVRVHEVDRRLGDVNLIFQPTKRQRESVGLSFCNHEPRSLWRRLDRVSKQWTAAKSTLLTNLVVLRSQAERTTSTAEKRLEKLKDAGVTVLLVDPQQLAELTAFQGMLTAAMSGDLTRNGKPVETTDYDAWVREHLSDAVKELLHDIFGMVSSSPGPSQEVAAKKAKVVQPNTMTIVTPPVVTIPKKPAKPAAGAKCSCGKPVWIGSHTGQCYPCTPAQNVPASKPVPEAQANEVSSNTKPAKKERIKQSQEVRCS